jgi:hypothetical protein
MFATSTYRSAAAINEAMGRVYGHMFLAVLTSMVVSFFVGTNPALLAFFFRHRSNEMDSYTCSIGLPADSLALRRIVFLCRDLNCSCMVLLL